MFKAVTSIWCVKDRLDHVVHYVEDEEKTVEVLVRKATPDYRTMIIKQMRKSTLLVSIVIHLIHANQ